MSRTRPEPRPATPDAIIARDWPGCACPWNWSAIGTLYGISLGYGWTRKTTDPKCPHHGDEAEAARTKERKP